MTPSGKQRDLFASTELAVMLFGAICLVVIPGTFLKGWRVVYEHWLFTSLLALFTLNLVLCTVRRGRRLYWAVLTVHVGVLLTLLGATVSRLGYVATVNLYEGSSVASAYRWDKKREMPLGLEMTLRRINREFHPVPVKIGVLRGDDKYALHTLKTGESFLLDGYRIVVSNLDLAAPQLHLAVYREDRLIGNVDTADNGELPAGFPFRFRLVAYQTPQLKRSWVDLTLAKDGQTIATGSSEVNHPLQWNGLSFFHVQNDRDENGNSYAGIQIVKDPGRPLVFTGMAVVVVGVFFCFTRRFQKARWIPSGQSTGAV